MGEIFTLENRKRVGTGGVLGPLGTGPGNTLGMEPLPIGPWDTNFGQDFALTDAKWRFTTLLPQLPGQELWRGDQWFDSNFGKYLVRNGRLLLQTPHDSQQYYVGDCALDVAVGGEDAVALDRLTLDGSENGGPFSFLFAWGQSVGSGLDLSNFAYIQFAEVLLGRWLLSCSLIQGGGGSILFSDSTAYDLGGCPWRGMGMHIKAGEMHFHAGESLETMMRLCVPQSCGFSPDRVALFVSTGNKPNNTVGLGSFLRRTDLTF